MTNTAQSRSREQFCLCRPRLALKGNVKQKRIHSPHFLLTFQRATFKKNLLRAVLACAESSLSNFKFKYLRENEFLRKTILACLSGDQMGLINENNRGKKSHDTARIKDHYIS